MTRSEPLRRPASDLPGALAHRERIRDRIGPRSPLFLDYDGTLTPIVAHPRLARLPDRLRTVLAALASSRPVAIMSGRDLRDVQGLVGLESLIYAGSHGFEIAGPSGLRWEHEEAAKLIPQLDRAQGRLASRLGSIDGLLIERKRFTLAVHYRNVAPDRIAAVLEEIDAVCRLHDRLRRRDGKMVVELQPDVAWDKGRAVEWLMDRLDPEGTAEPLYIGDDLTDEDALRVVAGRGVGIIVGGGARGTHADYRLADTDEVERLLRFLGTAV